ncbi:MAG TPA: hypothetical protein VHZ56_07635 [Devosia sp.]|jgi:hypothetical protein|nr:hypothetical protein [Devosia sp.]
MKKLLRATLAIGAAGLMAAGPLGALAADNALGMYQTTDRKMDYQLALCGTTAKNLCVTLVAARGSALTAKTKPFVGKYVVDQAKPDGSNKWKGAMHVAGYTVNGTLTLNPGKSFVMHGCAYVVVCQDFTLIPAK